MKHLMSPLLAALALAVACTCVGAQAPAGSRGPTGQLIYPAKGQGPQQAERDRFECHEWARLQSGFDPSQAAAPATPAATPPAAPANGSTAALADTVRGAAGGAAVAELADKDAGKGAAVGVLGAGLRQIAQRQQQQQHALSAQQQQQAQQQALQQAARAQQRSVYDRGFAACMEARGYVTK
jgi:hypothetical protein